MKPLKRNHKWWIAGLGVVIVLFTLFVPAGVSHADSTGGGALGIFCTVCSLPGAVKEAVGSVLSDISTQFVASAAFIVSYVIAVIVGVFIALISWLIAVMLAVNETIFQTTFVQAGFSIALSIANLAFVIGIIVIAVATILRSKNYGMKQLLVRLIAAAILVNFGLVIAAPIFGLGNSFSHYFLNCINPASGGCNDGTISFNNFNTFATTFAGAFQPQNSLASIGTGVQANTNITTGNGLNSLAGALSATGSNAGTTLVAVFVPLLTAINLILVLVVLVGLLGILFVRYIYISILAILMPFAWAAWVFPNFHKQWEKWWSNFLKWTFMVPIALFFIYLAMLLMQTANGATGATPGVVNVQCSNAVASVTAATALVFTNYQCGDIFTAISGFAGGALAPIMEAFLQELIFAGLIIGGLFAANALSFKMAKGVIGGVKGGAKAAGVWTAKSGTKAGLLAAARKVSPTTTDRHGNPIDTGRFIGLRKGLSTGITRLAKTSGLQSKKGLMGTTVEGFKKGSGWFKGHKKKGHDDDDHDGGGGGGHDDGGGGGRRGGGGGSRSGGGGSSSGDGQGSSGGSGASSGGGGGHGAGAHASTATNVQGTTQTGGQNTGNINAAPQQPSIITKDQVAARMDREGFGGGNNVPTPQAAGNGTNVGTVSPVTAASVGGVAAAATATTGGPVSINTDRVSVNVPGTSYAPQGTATDEVARLNQSGAQIRASAQLDKFFNGGNDRPPQAPSSPAPQTSAPAAAPTPPSPQSSSSSPKVVNIDSYRNSGDNRANPNPQTRRGDTADVLPFRPPSEPAA
jgi:hypothetical protein